MNGLKQFNYENVVNCKNTLITNRDKMDDLYRQYQSELNNLEGVWQGVSGTVSSESLQELINKYNGFLNKVNEIISALEEAEIKFTETEQTNRNQAGYNI